MKVYRISIGLLALILVLLTSGCGTLELGVESAQGKSGGSVEDVSAPLELLVARDTVLAYLRRAYADQAPGPDLDWQERETTPAEMVGSRSFEFSAAGWLMQVAFPIVAPEATIYTISLTAPDGVLSWQGEVDAVGRITSSTADQGPLPVVAWLGHIASLPAGTAEEDVFILEPQVGEEFGIRGADSSLEAEITSLRDAEGQGEFINVWGSLDCSGEGFSGCMLTVTRLLYGASSESVDEVDGWEGVIYSGSPVPGSGGDDYFALLGPYPVQYGIWSRDEVVLAGLEAQRDTGSVIRVYGQMMSGVPDWNNTQIQVDRFEAVENPSGEIPAAPTYPATGIRSNIRLRLRLRSPGFRDSRAMRMGCRSAACRKALRSIPISNTWRIPTGQTYASRSPRRSDISRSRFLKMRVSDTPTAAEPASGWQRSPTSNSTCL
jgi:hypothetical protein